MENSKLQSIYYVQFPEGTCFSKKALKLDLSIPLPVQKKVNQSNEDFDPKDISEEQILAGILTVLAYDKENKNTDYYRALIVEVRPNIKKDLSDTSILKIKNKDYDLAEEILLALQGIDPEDKNITLNMALYYDQRADSTRQSGFAKEADTYDEKALVYYKDAIASDPIIPDAYFNVGFYYLKQNNFEKAKDAFETYIALTCDIEDDKLGENGIYKKERAQQIVNEISSLNIDDVKFKKAYDLINKGEEEKGLEQIREFIKNNPKVWNAWFMLGWGLRRLKRYEDAIKAFEKAIEFNPESNSDSYNELAICYLETNEFDKAKNALLKALSISPESTKVISNLGFLELKQNNILLAQKYFLTVLEYDPNDAIAKQQLEFLENN